MRLCLLVVNSLVLAATILEASAAPVFYVSDQPLGLAQPGQPLSLDPTLATNRLNIYALPDVRLCGVSLDLTDLGGGIKFTGMNVVNSDNRWHAFDGPQQITDSQISSIGGFSFPGFFGNGIGPGAEPDSQFDPTSGYLLATVDFEWIDCTKPPDLSLQVGKNEIADWYGNIPMVHFGDASQPAVRGERVFVAPPAEPIVVSPPTSPISTPPAPTEPGPVGGGGAPEPQVPPPRVSVPSYLAPPLFYISDKPLGAARPGDEVNFGASGSTGQLNVYALTKTRLTGVSLDLVDESGGLSFTGLDVANPAGRWAALDGPQMVESSRVSSIGGFALPDIKGNGIGPGAEPDAGYDPGSGYLLATVDYQLLDPAISPKLSLEVGKNEISDWQGYIPYVHLGNANQAAVPGSRPSLPPEFPIVVEPLPSGSGGGPMQPKLPPDPETQLADPGILELGGLIDIIKVPPVDLPGSIITLEEILRVDYENWAVFRPLLLASEGAAIDVVDSDVSSFWTNATIDQDWLEFAAFDGGFGLGNAITYARLSLAYDSSNAVASTAQNTPEPANLILVVMAISCLSSCQLGKFR